MDVSRNDARALARCKYLQRVGEIIRRERHAQGLSQERLADMADMPAAVLSKMEHGRVAVAFQRMMDVLWALDASEKICLEIFRMDAESRRAAA
ncbi:helix-turn-helix domain-containing protein [Gluconobacter japonicus]|uniref:helix-turn-helix domain-containing protein n=1 Tax=Gluconobacter japonicus TaxID=376620 RepID=UPI0039E94A8C